MMSLDFRKDFRDSSCRAETIVGVSWKVSVQGTNKSEEDVRLNITCG
jgi:hypothetical protein